MTVPPRDRKGLRTGFTTGACAAAAARAATRYLLQGQILTAIETILPNRDQVTFALARCQRDGLWSLCSVIKDAGDDPDCTHGAEIVARVRLPDDATLGDERNQQGVIVLGGPGVARVTKPGLGLELGGPAINPVPRRNISEMVLLELHAANLNRAIVEISVPHGEEMAKKTTNARLGLLGGISILGTTGIVKPYSTAAYKASVVQAIDLAKELGQEAVVLTTGGKSETYAMGFYPDAPPEAFVQMGDFVGVSVRHAARRGLPAVRIVAMMGKLSKIADGVMQTHQVGSDVNFELLASLASELAAGPEFVANVRAANTARHVLELCQAHGVDGLPSAICHRAAQAISRHVQGALAVDVTLIDFDGTILGQHALAAASTPSPRPSPHHA